MPQNKKKPMNNNRIKEVRLAKHKTQKDLAKLLGVSEQAISYYEKALREPPLKSWIKMSDFLDVPVSYLQGVSNIADKDAYKSAEKWLDAIVALYAQKVDKQDGRETRAFFKESALLEFSLLFNAIIGGVIKDEENKKYTKLKDNISSVDSIKEIDFVLSEVFKIALEAKNGKKGAEKVYNKIHSLVNMFYDFYHHK